MIETNRQVKFKVMTEVGIELTDALYFSESQYASLTEKDIDVLIQERVDNFVFNYRNPPVQPEPTLEDAQAMVDALAQQQVQLDAMIDEALLVKSKFADERIDTQPLKDVLKGKRVEVADSVAALDDALSVDVLPVAEPILQVKR